MILHISGEEIISFIIGSIVVKPGMQLIATVFWHAVRKLLIRSEKDFVRWMHYYGRIMRTGHLTRNISIRPVRNEKSDRQTLSNIEEPQG